MRRRIPRRESGVLLLTVAFLLAIMAALSFTLNRGAGMDAHSVASDYQKRSAGYLAEAALAAAKWSNQVPRCGVANVPAFTLGDGTLSATVAKSSSGHISVTATATTSSGASSTLTRPSVALYDLINNTASKNLGGGPRDTSIDSTLTTAQNTMKVLTLTSNQSNALIYWPMDEVPNNTQVLSATLTLNQNGIGIFNRPMSVYRVTTVWDQNATWTRPRNNVTWTGGDYSPVAVASAAIGIPTLYQLNVTSIVDSWVSGLLPDDGFLLRLPYDNQSVSFYSLEATLGALRPVLNVTFAKSCP